MGSGVDPIGPLRLTGQSESRESSESIESSESSDSIESMESIESSESIDSIEFMEFMESVESSESIDSIEFMEFMESVESSESIDSIEFMEFMESVESSESIDSIESSPRGPKVGPGTISKVGRVRRGDQADVDASLIRDFDGRRCGRLVVPRARQSHSGDPEGDDRGCGCHHLPVREDLFLGLHVWLLLFVSIFGYRREASVSWR
jgi:hypothetical protein